MLIVKTISPIAFEHRTSLEGPLMGAFTSASTATVDCACRCDSRAVRRSSRLRWCQGFRASLQYAVCGVADISFCVAIIQFQYIQFQYREHLAIMEDCLDLQTA